MIRTHITQKLKDQLQERLEEVLQDKDFRYYSEYVKYLTKQLEAKVWTEEEEEEHRKQHDLYYWGRPTKADVKPSYRKTKKKKQAKVQMWPKKRRKKKDRGSFKSMYKR